MLAAEAEGVRSMLAEEAESMLGSEAEMQLEGEEESESESDWEEVQKAEQWLCRFRHCLCCWTFFPSGADRRVAPGIDYVRLPDTADNNLPAWSLLVGVSDKAPSSLRLIRLRVARSGRILGRSDDALDVFHNIRLAKPPGYCFKAAAAPLASDDSSLCVLTHTYREQPQALQLTLQPQPQPEPQPQADTKELPLPEIEGTTSLCMPISADGHIWALSATRQADGIYKSFSVVAQRLVSVSGGGRRWELVGRPFTGPRIHYPLPPWRGSLIQGYAVIPDAKLILVSFQQYGLFFTFAPHSGSWTRVLTHTDETRSQSYLPIVGRAIYVEHHKAVYILHHNIIYAYKLTYQKDDQLKLDLPVEIDYACPFISEQGYGLLTRLSSRLMCAVWISLARYEPCPCGYLHAIVTTFNIHDTQDPAQGGIKALHSTYRRIHMKTDPPGEQQFCFLQEYEHQGSLVLQQSGEEQEGLTSSQHGEVPSKMMLSCCRNMLGTPGRYKCGKNGGLSLPVEPDSSCPVVPLKGATTTIKKDLFIICQAGSRSVIYQTGAMDDVKPLELCYVADVGGSDCHFFLNGSKIHAVASIRGGMLEFSLNKDHTTSERPVRRPNAAPFVMVTRVGRETIALTETLQVHHQTQFNYGSSTSWLRYTADLDGSDVASRRVDITGYVEVSDDSFIVCDAVTCSCLQFDLGAKQWSVVMPLAAFKKDPPTPVGTKGLLNGRCVFVDGFIYTCREGGLAAYELLREDCVVYLSKPIFLPLSQSAHCVGEDMCLDYAGKDVDSGATLFYVVQGGNSPHRYGIRTSTFRITTVKVKTERTASNKMKPVGIDNMDSVTRVIHHAEAMDMRCCFAV